MTEDQIVRFRAVALSYGLRYGLGADAEDAAQEAAAEVLSGVRPGTAIQRLRRRAKRREVPVELIDDLHGDREGTEDRLIAVLDTCRDPVMEALAKHETVEEAANSAGLCRSAVYKRRSRAAGA